MEPIYCACVLANLEGQNDTPPQKEPHFTPATLSALDLRAQKLEGASTRLLPPPPTTPLTWDSLAWRVARLSHSSPIFMSFQSNPKVPLPPSLDLLDRIIEGINLKSTGAVPVGKGEVKPDEADGDDEKTVCDDKDADARRLDILRQRLCFAIGKRGRRIGSVPYDLASTCSLALYLSLDIETRGMISGPPRAMGIPPGPRAPGRPGPPINTVITRRCKCKCNRKKPGFGKRVGGFFRKLAWWKRKKGDDSDSDSSSYCSSTTSTNSSRSSLVIP